MSLGKSVTVRNVPLKAHRELSKRAAQEGQSLQEFLRGEFIRLADRPSKDDVLARIRERVDASVGSGISASEILKARDADRR